MLNIWEKHIKEEIIPWNKRVTGNTPIVPAKFQVGVTHTTVHDFYTHIFNTIFPAKVQNSVIVIDNNNIIT